MNVVMNAAANMRMLNIHKGESCDCDDATN